MRHFVHTLWMCSERESNWLDLSVHAEGFSFRQAQAVSKLMSIGILSLIFLLLGCSTEPLRPMGQDERFVVKILPLDDLKIGRAHV